MATVYSLICWGGRTGKTVTLTDAGDIVNLTNHGLRDGTPVQFASGTMPSGLALNTTYYSKSVSAGAFTLYTTAALTTQITWTGAGTGPFVLKSKAAIDYLASPPTSERWGTAGAERCYDGYTSARAARASGTTYFDTEVFEIGEAFADSVTNGTSLGIDLVPQILITTKINGAWSSGYHHGNVGQGYWMLLYVAATYPNLTIEGVTVRPQAVGQNTDMVTIGSINTRISQCIFYGYDITKCTLITLTGGANGCLITNNLILQMLVGIQNYGAGYSVISNNIVTKCSTGIKSAYDGLTYRLGSWYNNICVGNTVNWGVKPTSLQAATHNVGEGTDPVWTISPGIAYTMTTAAFKDWAGNDFSPALASSPQVDTARLYYGILEADLSDADRPSYNNGGSEAYDIGCYEFDNGYGPPPASTTVTFVGVKAGSEIRIFNTAGIELAGVESSSANPELSWVLPIGDVTIKIVADAYVLIEFTYSSIAGAVALPIQQVLDRWYSNP